MHFYLGSTLWIRTNLYPTYLGAVITTEPLIFWITGIQSVLPYSNTNTCNYFTYLRKNSITNQTQYAIFKYILFKTEETKVIISQDKEKRHTSSVRFTPYSPSLGSILYRKVLQIVVRSMGWSGSILPRSIRRCNSSKVNGGYSLRKLQSKQFIKWQAY